MKNVTTNLSYKAVIRSFCSYNRDEGFTVFAGFPTLSELNIMFWEMESESNCWFEENFSCRRHVV